MSLNTFYTKMALGSWALTPLFSGMKAASAIITKHITKKELVSTSEEHD